MKQGTAVNGPGRVHRCGRVRPPALQNPLPGGAPLQPLTRQRLRLLLQRRLLLQGRLRRLLRLSRLLGQALNLRRSKWRGDALVRA